MQLIVCELPAGCKRLRVQRRRGRGRMKERMFEVKRVVAAVGACNRCRSCSFLPEPVDGRSSPRVQV